MRILLINKYHYKKGGAERAYFDMAEILEAHGHEVAFFAMEHPENEITPWSKYFVSQVDYHDAQASTLQKIRTGLKIIWNYEANDRLQALIDDFKPDIAHAHNIYHQLSPSIFHVLKRNKVPIVLTLHDYKIVSPNYNLYADGNIWDHASGWRCIKDRCIQRSLIKSSLCACEKWLHGFLGSYKLVSLLLSPSAFLKSKVEALGWKGGEIRVLPNPLTKEELRGGASLLPVNNRLVFFGRLSPEKGVDQILQAAAQVHEKELVIIGEGPWKRYLKEIVRELGLENRVQFKGALFGNALQEELQKAEAVVIPSAWYENLPYVVTESLAQGLVVVAAGSGGITERIISGKNGFLYPLGNIQELANILQNLNQYDLETIRKNARESIQDLDPDIFVNKLTAWYQELL